MPSIPCTPGREAKKHTTYLYTILEIAIWLALNTFWGTLVSYAFKEWGVTVITWFLLIFLALFAFFMNLAINISHANLTNSRKKLSYIRDELRTKLTASSPQLIKLLDVAKKQEECKLRKDWYERRFVNLAWFPKKLYQSVGLIILVFWGVLTLISFAMVTWAWMTFGPG